MAQISVPIKDVDARQKLERLVRRIVEALDPIKVMLFGSWAKGTQHDLSDVDLVIIKEDNRPFVDRLREPMYLNDTDLILEVLVYTPEEWQRMLDEKRDFICTIAAEGKVLYERSPAVDETG